MNTGKNGKRNNLAIWLVKLKERMEKTAHVCVLQVKRVDARVFVVGDEAPINSVSLIIYGS